MIHLSRPYIEKTMRAYKKILLCMPLAAILAVPGFALQQPTSDTEARYKAKYGRLFPATERAQTEFEEAFRNRSMDLFDRLDKDGDGIISPSEWKGSGKDFSKLDKNHDGVISRAESRSRHQERFLTLDRDKDGTISRAEWQTTDREGSDD